MAKLMISRPDGTHVRNAADTEDVDEVDVDEANLAAVGIREHDGYEGMFTRDRADGAMPSGTRIVKTIQEAGDGHAPGATGVILGSVAMDGLLMYFIEWDDMPLRAVGTMSHKVEAEAE